MKQNQRLNDNCENFVQHYYYNKILKTFMKTNCGHCKKFKVSCDGCSYFIPRAEEVEKIEASIHNQLSHALYSLNFIIKMLKKEN